MARRNYNQCFHGEIFGMIEDHQASAIEAVLLVYVTTLSRCGDGLGCWATNAHLAKKMGISCVRVRCIISKLVERGLLIRTGTRQIKGIDYRLLETPWTRQRGGEEPGRSGTATTAGRLETSREIESKQSPLLENEQQSILSNTGVLDNNNKRTKGRRSVLRRPTGGNGHFNGIIPASAGNKAASAGNYDQTARAPKMKGMVPDSAGNETTRAPKNLVHAFWSKMLRQLVVAIGVASPRCPTTSWCQEFAALENQVGQDLVDQVLTWYVDHYQKYEKYQVRAWSAKAFRQKFHKIKDAWQRWLRDNPQVEIGQEAKDICQLDLYRYRWPKGARAQLPISVQLCLDYLHRLRRRIKVALKGALANWPRHAADDLPGFAEYLVKDHLSADYMHYATVSGHFIWVHGKVENWDSWNGDLKPFVFSDTNKWMARIAQEWASSWGFDSSLWGKLLAKLEDDQ